MACARRPVTATPVHGDLQGCVTRYKDVPVDSEQVGMSGVARQHVPIAIEAWRSQSRVLQGWTRCVKRRARSKRRCWQS